MEKIKYIFLILSFINILSCSNCDIQNKLEDISTYVCTNPDSAKKELNKINKCKLTTEQLSAYHALLLCESEYLTKRNFNDTILNIASKYYIENKKGTISQQMETKILYMYKKICNTPSEILPQLLKMEKQIHKLSSPYFKGMLESFITAIYYNNHEYKKMLEHSYLELKYANETKEIRRIINSKIHIGIAYQNMNMLDSAYINYNYFKKYEHLLDSTILSVAYHNLAILQKNISTADEKNIITALQNSLKYNTEREDSARTYLQIAQYYFNISEKEKADSFLNIFYNSIKKNDYDSYYNISKTLNNYYEKTGDIDSANKYKGEMLKYGELRDSAIKASRVMEITHQSEMEEIEEDSQTKIATISIISLVAIGALLWGIAVYRGKRNKLRQEYSDNVEKLHKIQEELEEAKEKERASRRAIASESQRHRFEVKRLTDMADTYSMKVLAMLTKNGRTDFKPTAAISEHFYTSINNVYSKTDKGKDFVKKITEACPSIKDRELFICLLYREGINNEKTISNILNVTDGTFRTIKSRLKKKLEEVPENCYINEILKSIGQ